MSSLFQSYSGQNVSVLTCKAQFLNWALYVCSTLQLIWLRLKVLELVGTFNPSPDFCARESAFLQGVQMKALCGWKSGSSWARPITVSFWSMGKKMSFCVRSIWCLWRHMEWEYWKPHARIYLKVGDYLPDGWERSCLKSHSNVSFVSVNLGRETNYRKYVILTWKTVQKGPKWNHKFPSARHRGWMWLSCELFGFACWNSKGWSLSFSLFNWKKGSLLPHLINSASLQWY